MTILTSELPHDHVVRPPSTCSRGRVGTVVGLDLIEGPLEATGVGV